MIRALGNSMDVPSSPQHEPRQWKPGRGFILNFHSQPHNTAIQLLTVQFSTKQRKLLTYGGCWRGMVSPSLLMLQPAPSGCRQLTYLARKVSKVTPSYPRNPHFHCCYGPQEGLSDTFQKVDGPTHSRPWASISVNYRDKPAYLVSQAPLLNYIAKVQNLAHHYQLLFYSKGTAGCFFLLLLFVVQSASHFRLFATPQTAACQAFLSFTISWSLLKLISIESVMPSNHLIFSYPLLLPSISPSIRVFSNESALRIRWPKYWSFSFSISPSNECSGLISFRIDCFDLLAIQGTLKSLQHHNLKVINSWVLSLLYHPTHIRTWLLEKL